MAFDSHHDVPMAESMQLQPASYDGTLENYQEEALSVPDISTRPPIPDQYEEDVIADDSITEVPSVGEEIQISYKLVEGATRGGKTLMVDSLGFSYNKKVLGRKKIQRDGKCTWRCSVRSKALTCPATVYQDGNIFTRGSRPHLHQGKTGAAVTAAVTAAAKSLAREKANMFTSATTLVDRAMMQTEGSDNACVNPVYLSRNVNRIRQKDRPVEPNSLDFELVVDHIPNEFLQKDIILDDARHLVFATADQLALLKKARTWYLDATFRVVRAPFQQLFGVHAFVKGSEGNVKQVPLAFILMSGKRKRDYRKVLNSILAIIQECKVEKIVMDFEMALWSVVRKLFPVAKLQGCAFHWNQAVWRKIQALGLAVPYLNHRPTQDYLKQLMALPFLPHEHITSTFDHLESRLPAGPIKDLTTYMRETWISGFWSPSEWTVFGQSIRTNNDVEGYHRRLNGSAGFSHIPFYVLVPLLFKEAKNVQVQVRLVKDGKLARCQRRKYRSLQGRIFSLWNKYEQHDLTTDQLLKACSRLSGPSV